jgi:hypothetical protein
MEGSTEIADNAVITIAPGGTKALTAVLAPAGVSGTVTWLSSNDAVVVSSSTGMSNTLTGGTAGSAAITVSAYNNDNGSGAVTMSFTVQVSSPQPITGLAVLDSGTAIGDALTLNPGEERLLTAELSPGGVTGTVSWSSDSDAVTVSPGTGGSSAIRGVTAGSAAAITVSAVNSDTATPLTKTFTVSVNTGYVPNPVTAITIQDGAAEIAEGALLTVNKAAVKTFSVTLNEGAAQAAGLSIEWTSDKTEISIVPADGGLSAVITVNEYTAGFAAITVKARNADNDAGVYISKTFKIEALLWRWSAAEAPWTSLATGGANVFKAPGFDTVSVRSFGAATQAAASGGIRLGGIDSGGNSRLAIGLASATGTASADTAATIQGDFDLSGGLVKLTLTYEDLTSYANRYVFRVYINNNSTGAGNSSLGTDSQIVSYNGPASANEPKLTAASGTVTVIIDPSKFAAHVNRAALEHAFIGLHCQNAGTSNGTDNGITITSITIERLASGSLDLLVNAEDGFAGFDADDNFTLSLSGAGGFPQTKTITLTGSYTAVQWFVDGEPQAAQAAFTLDAAGLAKKRHSLTVVVTKNGTLYSKTVNFSVVQ